MFCFHKFNPIDDKGIQYCHKCGKANAVKIPCNHKWELKRDYTKTYDGKKVGYILIYFCKECGEEKRVEVN